MAKRPLQTEPVYGNDQARHIALTWERWNDQRRGKRNEWQELRNYLFATDTTTTSNQALPWKNKTTVPKLCQIRDNLHSNYISALFPNDDWLRWEGYTLSDSTKAKKDAIQAYMANKCRLNGFRVIASQLLLDFIDYGNAFATVDYEVNMRESAKTNEMIVEYQGPVARRISPLDIVFDPSAISFEKSPKIVRSVVTIGELHSMASEDAENVYLKDVLARREKFRSNPGLYGFEKDEQIDGYNVDGFGDYHEYLNSGYVELLTFYGDVYDSKTCTLKKGRKVVVMDRCETLLDDEIPQWLGGSPIYHVGWRLRPDNIWGMGPLDNLVGMQYRIDHLENLKSDAMDLAVLPPLVISGEVEEFEYRPGAEIHIDENGSITELAKNAQWVIASENAIQQYEQRMEMYAGAPREAMGIRTAGEKTAFEVQQLQNAAGRIFQEKITHFEISLMEPLLNAMLETSVRNLNGDDVIKVIDNDLGASIFQTITKEDITANGNIRPIGARHFAAQAQLMQNLNGIFGGPMGQLVAPHTSTKALANLLSDLMNVSRYELFSPNVAIQEQQDTQTQMNASQEQMAMQDAIIPPEGM